MIRRDNEDNFYTHLQKKSIEQIEKLCGKIWTDYNAGNPGITALDMINYALYELHYQSYFPFEFYMAEVSDTVPDYAAFGLLAPEQLFIGSIVTCQDYEKLILSTYPQITHCCVELDRRYHYTIRIVLQNKLLEEEMQQKVLELYHAHRNLGENLKEVIVENTSSSSFKNFVTSDPMKTHFWHAPKLNFYPTKHRDYDSIQNYFPDCYGINKRGIPPHFTSLQKAKILQFKSYLLIFDFLLGNFKQQLDSVSEIMKLKSEPSAFSFPYIDIEDIHLLIDQEYFQNNRRESDFFHRQKSRYFNLLDRLYGESSFKLTQNEQNIEIQNKERAHLIPLLPEFNAQRFHSYNVLNLNPINTATIKRFFDTVFHFGNGREEPLLGILDFKQIEYTKEKTFYIIESILLESDESIDDNSVYIVFPQWCVEESQKNDYENFFLERMPAHLELRFLYLNIDFFYRFEQYYFAWRTVLAKGNSSNKIYYKTKLKIFLNSY
ncbi:MAG: hypothetical protein RR034_05630 [Bacteroidales bacterium]